MRQSIRLAHDGHHTVVLLRVGQRPGCVHSRIYKRVSRASLRRLERLAKANGFRRMPRQARVAGWWQREKLV